MQGLSQGDVFFDVLGEVQFYSKVEEVSIFCSWIGINELLNLRV
jgi:hypothetical protein